jgi:hypothetical protein
MIFGKEKEVAAADVRFVIIDQCIKNICYAEKKMKC